MCIRDRIIGTQISNGDEDRIDFSTTGWFERRGDSFVLSFDEYNADSGEIKTEVIMDGKAVTMQKTGAVETQMVFEPQKLYLAEYSTCLLYTSLYPWEHGLWQAELPCHNALPAPGTIC